MFAILIGALVFFWGRTLAAEFEDHFKNCHMNVPGFDSCVRKALNEIQPYFKRGLPEYNVAPFDPFFAKEIKLTRGVPGLGFNVVLRNVTESGWTKSKVTRFVSDLPNYQVRYTQSFPEKALTGDYEFTAQILGNEMKNKGEFTLTLYDLVQTTTISKKPKSKVQVRVDVHTIKDLSLHISHLLFGREILEGVADRIINGAWQPGFTVMRPLINELVSTAFTEIFGKAFHDFPFEKLITPKPTNTTSS